DSLPVIDDAGEGRADSPGPLFGPAGANRVAAGLPSRPSAYASARQEALAHAPSADATPPEGGSNFGQFVRRQPIDRTMLVKAGDARPLGAAPEFRDAPANIRPAQLKNRFPSLGIDSVRGS